MAGMGCIQVAVSRQAGLLNCCAEAGCALALVPPHLLASACSNPPSPACSWPRQVEWFSALEGAVAKIIKIVAGVDEEEERSHAHPGSSGGGGKAQSWAEQLERTYASVGACLGDSWGGEAWLG